MSAETFSDNRRSKLNSTTKHALLGCTNASKQGKMKHSIKKTSLVIAMFTCRVNTLSTTRVVALSTHRVDAAVTHQVVALFTQHHIPSPVMSHNEPLPNLKAVPLQRQKEIIA